MKMTKRILTALMALIVATVFSLSALAETAEANGNPPESMPGEPPEGGMPGNPPDGMPGEPPEGGMPGGPGGGPAGAPGGFGDSGASDFEYAGATEITASADETDGTYASATADESALIVNTAEDVTLENPTVTKTGDSNGGDSCNFYGLNAALLAMGGGTVTITGGTITSDADGANGVFCYGGNGAQNGGAGDGTTVYISDTTIATTGDGSGGIMTTGGGVTYATNLTVETNGRSSAAIRTDRGGGTVVVDGGSLTSLSGHMFHVTNTHAVITLTGVQLVNEDADGVLLSVCDDGWSGADNIAELNASGQVLTGTILVGDNSTLTLNLTEGSSFEGSIGGEIVNAKGETVSAEVGKVTVTLDDTSTWTLTADTSISAFDGDAANVHANGFTLYVNGAALEGVSE